MWLPQQIHDGVCRSVAVGGGDGAEHDVRDDINRRNIQNTNKTSIESPLHTKLTSLLTTSL